jgi:hypothetical protein
MFDAEESTKALQEAVRVRDREYLEAAVSDRIIWVEPVLDNRRGKRDWIEASCPVTWNWFQVYISRQLDLGDTRVVASWISLSREPVAGEHEREGDELLNMVEPPGGGPSAHARWVVAGAGPTSWRAPAGMTTPGTGGRFRVPRHLLPYVQACGRWALVSPQLATASTDSRQGRDGWSRTV